MKKQYLFLVVIFTSLCNISYAQMVGANCFLQGQFLEVGISGNGSWGPTGSPAGYHTRGGSNPNNLAHVYDYGHDGWNVPAGNLAYYGDYTTPGTNFEGWGMQANGVRMDAFQSMGPAAFWSSNPGASTLSGANVSSTVIAGVATGVWQGQTTGTSGGLSITQTTRVESGASWAVITTEFTNTSAAPIPGVYYWRTADPDNDVVISGNYNTNNRIPFQNDAAHRVMAASNGTSQTNAFLGLATKDCRAKAFLYTQWAAYPTQAAANTLDRIWNQNAAFLGTQVYNLNGTQNGDYAFGLIYNIGTINPGATAVISYAYVYNNVNGIDSAFPEPQLVTNGVPQPPSGPAPAPTYDTFDACNSGLSTLPVNINFASDKNWTNSSWTWSPATGLTTTTGVTNSINLAVLPPVITYTITGNDSNINMMNCNYRIMYLTVLTCNGAAVNSPCIGDSLIFNAPGDSTAATYAWYGPAPSTTVISTNQTFFKLPSTWADTGTYTVIKTVAGVPDTATITAVLRPKPVVTASSNSPLCIGALDTLLLFANSTVTPVTYDWTGPSAFASGLQNPTRPNIALGDTGLYRVIVTSVYGCKDTDVTRVAMLPPPGPPIVTGKNPYCEGEAFVPFNVTASGVVYWYPSANPVGGTTAAPTVTTNIPGTYRFYFNQVIGRCVSDVDSITITVHPKAIPDFTPSITFGCAGDVLTIQNNSSLNVVNFSWNFGDGSTGTGPNPTHTYAPNTTTPFYVITLVGTTAFNCSEDDTAHVDTRHDVTADFTPTPDVFCAIRPAEQTVMVNNSAANVTGAAVFQTDLTYEWNFGDGTTDVLQAPSHVYANAGHYQITLVVTDTIGCKATTMKPVTALRVDISSFGDSTICLRQPMRIDNQIAVYPDDALPPYTWTYAWTESPVTNLNDPTIRNPLLTGYGTFVDDLTATVQPWGCFDINTITVHSVLGQVLTNVTPDATIPYGSTIQLNSDNEVYYHWVPNDGSIDNPNINNPLAAPTQTTTYTVYGMDKYGCVDSAFVTITVDSTLNEGIPSAFTPNGDGLNDVFRPVGLKYQRLVEFRVYNRWGQEVYYTRDAKAGWDGTHNGVPQDLGVYHYNVVVAHPDGKNAVYKGDVTLVR